MMTLDVPLIIMHAAMTATMLLVSFFILFSLGMLLCALLCV